MILSDISIRRPVFAWMLMAFLIVFGAISVGRLGVSQMPDVDFPVLNIGVTWEGTAPEILETEVVDRLEQQLIQVEGIREMRSKVRAGSADITVEFNIERNVDVALQEVQAAVSQVRLPREVDPPIIRKSNPEDEPIIVIGFGGERSIRDLVVYADLTLRDQLQTIPGVGEVALFGFADRNLRIWLDNEKLRRFQLTVLDVERALTMEHSEVAAGILENDKREWNLRTMGEGMSVQEVEELLITERGGRPIYDTTLRIKDVARVEDGLSDIRRVARVNGRPAIAMGIKKQRGTNAVEVARAVRSEVERLQKTLPPDLTVQVNVDYTVFVEQSVGNTIKKLLIASLLTGLLCWLFLGDWSHTANVLMSIPTSVFGTFMVMYFLDFTLNIFTLLALAMAIGIVVDDAIMVLENIVRHFHGGKDRVNASLDGAREITFAAVAATVAVIAIFLPIAFMQGIIGKFLYQFGVTLSAAVALSLLEAITLTPMRCSQMMRQDDQSGGIAQIAMRWFEAMNRGYGRLLETSLRFPLSVLVVSAVLFVGSLFLATKLKKEFVPSQDQSLIRMSVQTPVGSAVWFTDTKIKEIEKYIQTLPEVVRYFVVAGAGPGFSEANRGFAALALKPRDQRSLSQAELMDKMRKDLAVIPQVRVTLEDISTRGFSPGRTFPVSFGLRGASWSELDKVTQEIIRRLEQSGKVIEMDTNYRAGMPELRVIPDRTAAARRGVTMAAIGQTINAGMGGVRVGKFSSEGRRYDIRLRLLPEERIKEDDLQRLQVRTLYGELIPLSEVVRVETVPTLQTITRVNRQRGISVTGNLAPGASQAEALELAEKISRELLPEGYTFALEGGAQTFKESFGSLWFALGLGVVVSYMVLASQFNSFLHPLSVLLALPFSVSGALGALWLAGLSLNIYSMMGLVLLMGISKKNSILLVEFANQLRSQGISSVPKAVVQAGAVRLRPILMTTLATIGAALPSALPAGAGWETRVPLAIVIVGGMVISTLFTLIVVPCAYTLMVRWERRHPHTA
jgi:HAE1 family hydrophobic/amphiphilic exporter-1